ncbi:unnamed protein product [Rotaria sp. Silwood2]|nr:unnamed protein product [Rotaria sp. Silwood2]
MLNVQRWLKTYARDVLDESDEILHVKYQLIYTIGGQQQVDGGAERWKTIQTIFILLKKHCQDIFTQFQEKVFYKPPARKSAFPQFRLQSHEPYAYLCTKISKDWIDSRNYRHEDKNMILSFIRDTLLTSAQLDGKFPSLDIQLFLMVRGLLTSEVLLVALRKRHRVNYGVNPSLAFNRLMAVPFRAKDVVADRTEFGHPDVALVLSHLSYYYSGLSNSQLSQCFKRLSESEIDPVPIYDQWVLYEDNVPNWLKQWKGVNLKDCQQCRAHLFPTFRHNMLVINYFLNHFVFPREAKQFPQKLVASSWDLSSSLRSQLITGFSGTNDTQLLLPVHIRQHDLPELKKTDAIVISNLLQPDNAKYQFLTIDATSESILKEIIKCEEPVNVILDVGALFIDESNRDIALQWLKLSSRDKIDYAVYFDNDTIFVCDRQYHHHPFAMSPASERLDHCVFYLDEIHTRGTDFKFPIGFKAAVTLGVNLTKDRFVQACMRMRKLGHGHSLMFWSSCEVHQQIEALKKKSQNVGYKKIKTNQMICLYDILHWVYKNTQKATWDGLHYWATQSLSYQRKISAYHNVQWTNHQQQFTDVIMKQLATECVEPEMLELMRMYGCSKTLKTLFEIHQHRYQQTCHDLCNDIRDAVLYRLQDYGGAKQRLSQLLDEEQQRELEQELEEERQLEPPPPVDPCTPKLHPEIKRLCGMQNIQMDLQQYPHVFQPLPYAYVGTTFLSDCQFNSWEKNMWISTEFQRVVETKGDSLNPFLRPPRWIIVYRNQELVVLSPLEANWIMGRLNSLYREGQLDNASNTTLRLLLPRVKRNQSILINTPTLSVPPLIGCPMRIITSITSLDFLAQLFIFNGSLYFESIDEQTIYCQLLSLCPNPRTQHEEKAFERGWIGTDGFVSEDTHRTVLQMGKVRFRQNLLNFVKQIIEMRNHTQVPLSSHVGSILLDARKML